MKLLVTRIRVSLFLSLTFFLSTSCGGIKSPPNDQIRVSDKPVSKNNVITQPQVEVLIDEAMLKKPYAIIGGTITNKTSETFTDLKINLELKRRSDGGLTMREVAVNPASLAPGEHGRYSIQVLSDEWEATKFKGIHTGNFPQELTFITKPGASRPPEIPQPVLKIVSIPRSKSKSRSEEFINTPDNPIRVP